MLLVWIASISQVLDNNLHTLNEKSFMPVKLLLPVFFFFFSAAGMESEDEAILKSDARINIAHIINVGLFILLPLK